MVCEIDWIDPTKSEVNWKGRMGMVCEIDWIDPTKNEVNWKG